MRWNAHTDPGGPRRRGALVVTLAAPAPAAVVAGPATVVGVGSGRCLDVNGGARTAKTGVSIHDCTAPPTRGGR